MCLLGTFALLFFSACSLDSRHEVDRLNGVSYACHYENLDSTLCYARLAYELSRDNYSSGAAEALNNIVFVDIAYMHYDSARQHLDEIFNITDNQIELLVADIQYMRLCQRVSANRDFYMFRERAMSRLKRIEEEIGSLSQRNLQRLVYAETEFAIINSTYYYYVGLEKQSIEALNTIDPNGEILKDTAQYLNYLYNIGAGGIIQGATSETVRLKEIEFIDRCLRIARESECLYFEANAMEAMAEHGVGIEMAGNALMLFQVYGDIYQIAAAHRTLGRCYTDVGDYEQALYHLNASLADSMIIQAPDLVASIHEQMGLTYMALGDSLTGEYYRKLSEDILEDTRRDRYYEAQASMLEGSLRTLDMMIFAVVGAIIILIVLLVLFYYLNKRAEGKTEKLSSWQLENQKRLDEIRGRQEEIDEECRATQNAIKNAQRVQIEHRSRLALVNSALPFIDRIINEVTQLSTRVDEDETQRNFRLTYICELAERINEYNEVLAEWIRIDTGILRIHVTTFPLQEIFDTIERSRVGFAMKEVTLTVNPTDAMVKADKVLTLFMLNTLADNARKFTPKGGNVSIYAVSSANYVEISVKDTGCGISKDRLSKIFDRTTYEEHGFGLMNCRGIINTYHKLSNKFAVCTIAAESEEGRGSRFFFRLPKGIARVVVMSLLSVLTAVASPSVAQSESDFNVDNTLAEYCRVMQKEQSDRTISVVLLALILFAIPPAYYVLYYSNRLTRKFEAIHDAQQELDEEILKTKLNEDELKKLQLELQNLYVSNMVLNNCFSTLKHETVYYPNRILNLINIKGNDSAGSKRYEDVDMQDLRELVHYYRDIYFMFSQQAVQQVEHVRLNHLVMLDYLMEILQARFKFNPQDVRTTTRDDGYIVLTIPISQSNSSSYTCNSRQEVATNNVDSTSYFTPSIENIPMLICRQIVREHAEATNHFGCGIDIKRSLGGGKEVVITLASTPSSIG